VVPMFVPIPSATPFPRVEPDEPSDDSIPNVPFAFSLGRKFFPLIAILSLISWSGLYGTAAIPCDAAWDWELRGCGMWGLGEEGVEGVEGDVPVEDCIRAEEYVCKRSSNIWAISSTSSARTLN